MKMDVRAKILEITKTARAQTDLDAIVTRAGGLGALFAAEFPGAARDEFLYEWDSRKMTIKNEVRS